MWGEFLDGGCASKEYFETLPDQVLLDSLPKKLEFYSLYKNAYPYLHQQSPTNNYYH